MTRIVERRADAAVATTCARVAARLSEALPGIAVEAGDDAVTLTGQGLRRDPRLRWIGGWLR